MQKFELSLASDYVSDWGVKEGIRELFQNALDQQTVEPSNKMLFDYDEDSETLRIGNLKSKLQINTLLLGSSTKANNDNTIGQFGEGYKVGTLALIRAEKEVIFYNYGNKQIWKPRFVNSRRYKTKVLTFFVEKQAFWNPVPNHDLVIEIKGITGDEMNEIKRENLHLKKPDKFHDAQPYGQILLDPDQRGRIYVNGLFVELTEFSYGYNFNPDRIKLGRDRRTIPNFELKDTTSYMWGVVKDSEELTDLIRESSDEVCFYISNTFTNNRTSMSNKFYSDFKYKHGENAIPYSYQEEKEEIEKNYPEDVKTVYVPYQEKILIKESINFEIKSKPIPIKSLKDRFEEWFNKVKIEDQELIDEFYELLDEVE